MTAYLRNYGFHFSKKACDYAVKQMRCRNVSTGRVEKLVPMSKDEVDDLLKKTNTVLENEVMYDHVYVANMAKADFLHSSIADDVHLAKYVKDVLDDPDAVDGQVFNTWYACMCHAGVPIEWEDLL